MSKYYGTDIRDEKNFDIVYDTTRNSVGESDREVIRALNGFLEGKARKGRKK